MQRVFGKTMVVFLEFYLPLIIHNPAVDILEIGVRVIADQFIGTADD
jgi:hypothetical protein